MPNYKKKFKKIRKKYNKLKEKYNCCEAQDINDVSSFNNYHFNIDDIDKKDFCQTLTEDEIDKLMNISKNKDFTLAITKNDINIARCMHIDKNGNSTIEPINHCLYHMHQLSNKSENYSIKDVKCSLCGEEFSIYNPLEEITHEAWITVKCLIDVVQTTKTLYVDMPREAAQKYYTVLAYLYKYYNYFHDDMKDKNFNLDISEEEKLIAICMHRNLQGHSTIVTKVGTNGSAKCKICGKQFNIIDGCYPNDIENVANEFISILQSMKIANKDAPIEVFDIIPMLKKLPMLYDIASRDFTKHENKALVWQPKFYNIPNGYQIYM